jgi:hypothetical protein
LRSKKSGRILRRAAVAGVLGTAVAFVAIVVVDSGLAAAQSKPSNTAAPRIFGFAHVGQVLTGDRGTWTNSPTSYSYAWLRCDTGGNGCNTISSANGLQYTLGSADDGHTIRFRVTAANSDGSTTATSPQTAVVVASASRRTRPRRRSPAHLRRVRR